MILVGTTWHAFNKSSASNFKCSRLSRRPDPIRSSDIVVLFYQLSAHNTAVVYSNETMQCMFDHVTVFLSVNMASVDLESVVSTNLTQQTTCWELVLGFNMRHLYINYTKSRIAHKYPDHFICKTCCLFSLDIYSSHSMSTAATPLIHSALISIDLHCR